MHGHQGQKSKLWLQSARAAHPSCKRSVVAGGQSKNVSDRCDVSERPRLVVMSPPQELETLITPDRCTRRRIMDTNEQTVTVCFAIVR